MPENRSIRKPRSKRAPKQKDPRKELVKGLMNGYRHRPAERLRWLLDDVLERLGRPNTCPAPEEARDQIAELGRWYALTVQDEAPFTDVLGPVYMELASSGGKKWLGQFFTPQSVALMMAQMQDPDHPPPVEPGKLVTVCDPACGSGVMLLSMAQIVHQRAVKTGEAGVERWSFTGVDLDSICARMAAVQLLTNNAVHGIEIGEIVVFEGDSLRLDREMQLIVHATGTSVPAEKVIPADAPRRIKAICETAHQTGQAFLTEAQQLGLDLSP